MTSATRRRLVWVLISSFLLLQTLPAVAAQAGRSYGESVRALKQKDWKKAEAKIREALEKEGNSMESILISGSTRYPYLPYYVLGAALYGQGDCEGALTAWQESLRQGQVQSSPNELAELGSGMTDCQGRVAQTSTPAGTSPPTTTPGQAEVPSAAPTPAIDSPASQPAVDQRFAALSDSVRLALQELDVANARYRELARDSDLEPEWRANWKASLDASEAARMRLAREYEQAVSRQDITALENINRELGETVGSIVEARQSARKRIESLQAKRMAESAAKDEERKRQEALEEQRRLAIIREREAAEQRQRELAQRERIATAQRGLQQALDDVAADLDKAGGDERVDQARRLLAAQVSAARSLLGSTDVEQVNRQAQSLRDEGRRYSQARQEWEAAQREIALRTPPAELREIADAYFAGDYQKVSRLAEPDRFSDERQRIQVYLFRSAAKFNLYWLTGADRQELLLGAKRDIAELKKLNASFVPYVAAFPPRYVKFFGES